MFVNHCSNAIVENIHFKGPIILQRIEGTIIWFSIEQGYGIIRQNLNKKTISINQSQIHYNSLKDVGPLSIGQRVSFIIDNLIARDLYIL
jgi:cold shock CspA family protein